MFFVLYCRKVALRAPGRPSAAVFGDLIATKIYFRLSKDSNSRNFYNIWILENLINFLHQKNTLSHFTKTKHFSKTRKTQKLREYRKYQNKIDNYYGFLQINTT